MLTCKVWFKTATLASDRRDCLPVFSILFFPDDALFYLAENCDSASRKAPMILFCSRTLQFWLNGNRSDYAIMSGDDSKWDGLGARAPEDTSTHHLRRLHLGFNEVSDVRALPLFCSSVKIDQFIDFTIDWLWNRLYLKINQEVWFVYNLILTPCRAYLVCC